MPLRPFTKSVSKMHNTKYIKTVESTDTNEKAVIQTLVKKFSDTGMNIESIIFFCSTNYDLDKISAHISTSFDCTVIGCTSAGEIGETYQHNGIVASAFSSEKFKFHSHLIHSLSDFNAYRANVLLEKTSKQLNFSNHINDKSVFGMLLIDSLAVMEESIMAVLYQAFQGLPIIGGSAGDDLKFQKTSVYHQGKFHSNSALFTVIETSLAFETFKLQHFFPSGDEMIITKSDPENRTVHEINGEIAAKEYARLVHKEVDELDSHTFASHPVMLQIGGDWYVRSIQKVNSDGSLTFACAIDVGLPLTLAHAGDFLENIQQQVNQLQHKFHDIELTLGFDCVFRRLELQQNGKQKHVEKEMQKINFMGVSTYGEQYNMLHVNHTLTAVTFGNTVASNRILSDEH